jgi:hypothetical protein
VNAVELRRSIIEAGDVIELGDVRFKFVGAGQIFVPGPNESQQLTAITDREAELAPPTKRGWGGYFLPIMGAGIVGAGIIVAFVFFVGRRSLSEGADAATAVIPDPEQTTLADAKRTCTPDDCEAAHTAVAAFPDDSPWAQNPDFRYVESTWGDSLLRKARAETDPQARRALLLRVVADSKVDPAQKKAAQDMLDAASPVAVDPAPTTTVTVRDAGGALAQSSPTTIPPPPRPPSAPTSHVTTTNATTNAGTSSPAPTPSPKPTGPSTYERAREAALRGEPAAVRQLLESRVRNGHATNDEASLVRQACKLMHDQACADDVKQKYPGS